MIKILLRALKFLNEVLDSGLVSFIKTRPNVARNYNNLGSVYRGKGKLDKAISYYNKAIDVNQALYDATKDVVYYMELAEKNLILADLYGKKEESQEAIDCFCQGADMMAKTFHFVRAEESFLVFT